MLEKITQILQKKWIRAWDFVSHWSKIKSIHLFLICMNCQIQFYAKLCITIGSYTLHYTHTHTHTHMYTLTHIYMKWKWSRSDTCPTLCDPVACQALLSMGFSRQEYWSELPFLSLGDLPDPSTWILLSNILPKAFLSIIKMILVPSFIFFSFVWFWHQSDPSLIKWIGKYFFYCILFSEII